MSIEDAFDLFCEGLRCDVDKWGEDECVGKRVFRRGCLKLYNPFGMMLKVNGRDSVVREKYYRGERSKDDIASMDSVFFNFLVENKGIVRMLADGDVSDASVLYRAQWFPQFVKLLNSGFRANILVTSSQDYRSKPLFSISGYGEDVSGTGESYDSAYADAALIFFTRVWSRIVYHVEVVVCEDIVDVGLDAYLSEVIVKTNTFIIENERVKEERVREAKKRVETELERLRLIRDAEFRTNNPYYVDDANHIRFQNVCADIMSIQLHSSSAGFRLGLVNVRPSVSCQLTDDYDSDGDVTDDDMPALEPYEDTFVRRWCIEKNISVGVASPIYQELLGIVLNNRDKVGCTFDGVSVLSEEAALSRIDTFVVNGRRVCKHGNPIGLFCSIDDLDPDEVKSYNALLYGVADFQFQDYSELNCGDCWDDDLYEEADDPEDYGVASDSDHYGEDYEDDGYYEYGDDTVRVFLRVE